MGLRGCGARPLVTAVHTFVPFTTRCVGAGLAVMALGVLLEISQSQRAAVFVGLHVAAMSLLTAGAIGARGVAASRVCGFWATSGALLEVLQTSRAVDWLLPKLPEQGPAGAVANVASLVLVNGEFTGGELIGAIVGGCVAFALIHRIGGPPHA